MILRKIDDWLDEEHVMTNKGIIFNSIIVIVVFEVTGAIIDLLTS